MEIHKADDNWTSLGYSPSREIHSELRGYNFDFLQPGDREYVYERDPNRHLFQCLASVRIKRDLEIAEAKKKAASEQRLLKNE